MLDLWLAAGRAVTFFAGFATFFLFEIGVRFAKTFFGALRLDADDLEAFRLAVFNVVALFAFGRTDFTLTARPLTDDFAGERRTGVRDVERLSPFVMGLLIQEVSFQFERSCCLLRPPRTSRSLTQLPL